MPLRHFDPVTLRLFVAVCEERNIARAAAREALVASAVSKRIAAVERAVGAPLLSVLGPTDAARWGALGPTVQHLQQPGGWPTVDSVQAHARSLLRPIG